MVKYHVPVLFDVAGTATVLGESIVAPSFHIQEFNIDYTTSDSSLTFTQDDFNCFRVAGDQTDNTSNLFFTGVGRNEGSQIDANNVENAASIDNFCTKLAAVIASANFRKSNESDNLGMKNQTTKILKPKAADGDADDYYETSICNSKGSSLASLMARTASVHLVGHPLAQVIFTDEDDMDTSDLNAVSAADSSWQGTLLLQPAKTTSDIASDGTAYLQTGQSNPHQTSLAKQLSKHFGGSQDDNPINKSGELKLKDLDGVDENTKAKVGGTIGLKSEGVANPVLKAILEQMLDNDAQLMKDTHDISGVFSDSTTRLDSASTGNAICRTATLGSLFSSGDEISIYIRPKVTLSLESGTDLTLVDSAGGSSLPATAAFAATADSTVETVFPRAKHQWMGGSGTRDFSDHDTDLTTVGELDCHIWKINIKVKA